MGVMEMRNTLGFQLLKGESTHGGCANAEKSE